MLHSLNPSVFDMSYEYVTVGCYSRGKFLGSGAYGNVYLATDFTGKEYAMKLMRVATDECIQNVIDEVHALRQADFHKNIVKMFDAFYDKKVSIVVILEYCEGGNLDRYVDGKPTSTKSFRKSFMLDMARGVQHLHDNGIAHRDLKPGNVLLIRGDDGIPVCKLADFGLARTKAEGAVTIFMESYVGTRYFMAPEVGNEVYKKSCDLFSLGLIFYVLFSCDTCPTIGFERFRDTSDEEVQHEVQSVIHGQSPKHADFISHMLRFTAEERPKAEMVVSFLEADVGINS